MSEATATAVKFRPLKERVFVRYETEPEKTASGLYIPDAAKEKPQKGTIEAIGSEVKDVKVGETILFDKYSGSKINIEDEEFLIIKEEDILGVIG